MVMRLTAYEYVDYTIRRGLSMNTVELHQGTVLVSIQKSLLQYCRILGVTTHAILFFIYYIESLQTVIIIL